MALKKASDAKKVKERDTKENSKKDIGFSLKNRIFESTFSLEEIVSSSSEDVSLASSFFAFFKSFLKSILPPKHAHNSTPISLYFI